MVDVNDFNAEKSCVYRGEEYLVRDNGAVLRKSIPQKRKRSYDNEWTFGKPNANGYLVIASVPIHRIVATAFHGDPPTEEHVVDHKDTNKQNNRPDNLRWITRLENVVLNEFTCKKIEHITGVSIYEFLKNPVQYKDCFTEPNYSWMRTVSAEEAKKCLETLTLLFAKEKPQECVSSKIGEWVYGTQNDCIGKSNETDSLTPTAKQVNWKTPCDFVCCPKDITDSPIESYFKNLSLDAVFCSNQYGKQTIIKYSMTSNNAIIVMCDISEASNVKNYALAKITFENGYYIHESLGTFFFEVGAEKQFLLEQGLEWTGREVFDDYC